MSRPSHVPEHLVVDYNAFGNESPEELLAKIEQWRQIGPVVWTDQNYGHWVVLDMEPLRTVMEDSKSFTSSKPGQGVTLIRADRPLHVPLELDGAEHREYRKIVMPLFAPGRVKQLQGTVRSIVQGLIADISARGECDVIADYARPIASTMFLSMVDWPIEDRLRLEGYVEQSLNTRPNATPEEMGEIKTQAVRQMAAYAMEQIADRRLNPRDDMTTTIMNARLSNGDPIPEGRLVPMMVLLLLAGLDTMQSVLGRSIDYLARHPDEQEVVRRACREDSTSLVEELLRMNTPAIPNRTATVDAVVGGAPIAAGDTVQCLLAAANRDPSQFDAPLVPDFFRAENRHVAFSTGPHKCLGSALARVMLGIALEEFHEAFDYSLVESHGHTGAVWGMSSVKVAVTPARVVA